MTPGEEQQIESLIVTTNIWMNGDAARWALRATLDEVKKLRLEIKALKEKDVGKS